MENEKNVNDIIHSDNIINEIISSIEWAIIEENKNNLTRGQCYLLLLGLYEKCELGYKMWNAEMENPKRFPNLLLSIRLNSSQKQALLNVKYFIDKEKCRFERDKFIHIRQYIQTMIAHYSFSGLDTK